MADRVVRCLLLLLLLPACAFAADTIVLLDRSGSMKPHYESQLMKTLATSIVNAASEGGTPDIAVFDETVVPIRGLDSAEFKFTSRDTFLTSALSSAVRHHVRVWLLTDNVQDVHGSHDMADFYGTLQRNSIRQVYVFPLRQPPGNNQGLLIYALSSQEHDAILEKQVALFREAMKDRRISELVMKPLAENTIQIRIVGESTDVRQYREGDVLKFSARVRIGPKYPHLYFEASPTVATSPTTPFQQAACLTVERHSSTITPDLVKTEDFHEYEISVDFGRVRLKPSLSCIWTAAFGRSQETEEIDTALAIRVPQEHYRLSRSFLDDFTAANETEAKATGKIAGLQDLPAWLAPKETVVPIRVPTRVSVRYPSWPGFLMMLLAGAAILICFLAVRAVSGLTLTRPRVLAETMEGVTLPAEVKGGQLLISGKSAGAIKLGKFIPTNGVRLYPNRSQASLATPFECVASDGSHFRVTFGASAPPAVSAAGKSTASVMNSNPPSNSTGGGGLRAASKTAPPKILKKR